MRFKRAIALGCKRVGQSAILVAGVWRRVSFRATLLTSLSLLILIGAVVAHATDWPTWRADATRSASIAAPLPAELHLCWTRQLERPESAWPASQHKLQFDRSYEPIVAGKRLFVGSMVADYVAAFDTESGALLWRTFLEGPVRFAPLHWRGRLYVACDDGLLHCLDATRGNPLWVMRGAPDQRKVLGSFRLISAWPMRGAPVLRERADGGATLYCTAGIWPFMGIFIYAVDAASGELIWRNGGTGSTYVTQQHNSPAFAGVAPQGYLAVQDEILMIPGGRTVPAGFNAQSGEMLYFEVSSRGYGKDAGGYAVSTMPGSFLNHGCLYKLESGEPLLNLNSGSVVTGSKAERIGQHFATVDKQILRVYDITPKVTEVKEIDRKGKEQLVQKTVLGKPLQSVELGWEVERVWFRAGERIYLSGRGGEVAAVSLPQQGAPLLVWQGRVAGTIFTMLPGDNKLFVVTEQGYIYCFGGTTPKNGAVRHDLKQPYAEEPLSLPGPHGYTLVFGLDEGGVKRVRELAQEYHVVAFDPDMTLVKKTRDILLEEGLYGRRVHLLPYVSGITRLPPYLASHIECHGGLLAEPATAREVARQAWHALRPYGGKAVFYGAFGKRAQAEQVSSLLTRLTKREGGSDTRALPAGWEELCCELGALEGEGARVEIDWAVGVARLLRPGALPGAATWSHENGDVGNTDFSKDKLVKQHLGMLWFGGLSNDDILPRHGHGPMPQIVGGRLYIEGPDALRAVDVYTGRLFWQRRLEGLGKFYDNTSHQPGANEIGGNYVSMPDGIYVVHQGRCLRLDPATGKTVSEFVLPPLGDEPKPLWGYIGVYRDWLLAGASPLLIKDVGKNADKDALPTVTTNAMYASSSKWLVILNRHTGEKLWAREAAQVFRHNAIVAGNGKVFLIDRVSDANLQLLKRRGIESTEAGRLFALDINTGQVVWESGDQVRGTWLGYDEPRDLLLEGGSPGSDRARDETSKHLALYRGAEGRLLWRSAERYIGRPMLHNKVIYTDRGSAFNLEDGTYKQSLNHLTGKMAIWSFTRNYGCNTPIAGEHLLLFRSAAAGFYDLLSESGTGNFGGFKSGCTSNLIPADGVLNVPDYTRTCTCSYQNQCSMALVSMPDVELWTFQAYDKLDAPVVRAGLNFGAPGDWLAPSGTLWLDCPSVGGKGPDMQVRIRGEVKYFRDHALTMLGDMRQVTASGVEGNFDIKIPLKNGESRNYTVCFYFAEPDHKTVKSERAFDLFLQGKRVIRAFDILGETGQPRMGLVKEFTT